MFLKSISLTNILSFGDKTTHIELRPLNILIGHNGSGKSNLIECISLLQAIPESLAKALSEGGGVTDYIWKGHSAHPKPTIYTGSQEATIESVTNYIALSASNVRHRISFTAVRQRFVLVDETIDLDRQDSNKADPSPYFYRSDETGFLRQDDSFATLTTETEYNPNNSILSQLKDPSNYPYITWLGNTFRKVRIYRKWHFGRDTPARLPQRSDMPNDFLAEDCSNLGLILNKLRMYPEAKRKVLENLRNLYPSAEDFNVLVEVNSVQVFIQEGDFLIPATRLSDGTLRFLCLLAILCHPNPPPLICIEEPELGLHPDMIHIIADLLRDAATRTQLIVTTHSDLLVEEFTDEPECILTFEKQGDQSEVHRVNAEELAIWLEKYSLGQLRRKGHIAGNRW